MRYRHVWPGFLLLGTLAVLLAALLIWGDHFLSPGPSGGLRRLLQLWAASRPPQELAAPPAESAPPRDGRSVPGPAAGSADLSREPGTAERPEAPGAGTAASVSGGSSSVPPGLAAATPPAGEPGPPQATPRRTTVSPSVGTTGEDVPGREGATAESSGRSAGPASGGAPSPAARLSTAAAPPKREARYALDLGTFAVAEEAERVEARLNQAGFTTVRFRQQAPARLFSVLLQGLRDTEEGQAVVERLRQEGFGQAVLLARPEGLTIRVLQSQPLRLAVSAADKLRDLGLDPRVAAEPGRAGHITLRHGNFGSRREAEEASAQISALGVPNEVVEVR
jgi:hypothetical protein